MEANHLLDRHVRDFDPAKGFEKPPFPVSSGKHHRLPLNQISLVEEDDDAPLRPIFCLKNNGDLKRFDQTEDCYILDFDPFESINFFNLPFSKDDKSDLCVLAQNGQVACIDYPHSRNLCLNFPFETTAHENYCKMCYCYVCETTAPCEYWKIETTSELAHCHASPTIQYWKLLRKSNKKLPH